MYKYLAIFFTLVTVCNNIHADDKIRVACIGDSITFGSKVTERAKNSYPSVLQELLGDSYKVGNFGNPGRGIIKTSKRGKGKRAFIFMKEHKAALNFKPNIVICNLGINDLMDYPKKSTEFIPDYKELINSYRKLPTKPQIIVWKNLAPLMKGQKFYGSPTVAKINMAIAKAVEEMNADTSFSKKIITIDMENPLNKPSFFTKDKIHPNNTGAKKIATITAKALKNL